MPKNNAKKSRQQLVESESSTDSESDSCSSSKSSSTDEKAKKKSKSKAKAKGKTEKNKKHKKRSKSTSSSSSSSSGTSSSSSSSSSKSSASNNDYTESKSKQSKQNVAGESKSVASVRRKILDKNLDRKQRVREDNEHRSGDGGIGQSGGSDNRSKWDSPSRDNRDRRYKEHNDRKYDNSYRDRQFGNRDKPGQSGRSNVDHRTDKHDGGGGGDRDKKSNMDRRQPTINRHDNPFDRNNKDYHRGQRESSREHEPSRNVRDNRNRDDRDNRNRDDRGYNRNRQDRDNNSRNYRENRDDDKNNRRDRNRSTERNRGGGGGGDERRRSRSPRRPRNFPRKNEDDNKDYDWGKKKSHSQEPEAPPIEKEKPNFALSGKLAEDTNKVNGTLIKYSEPQEARKPKRRWRLYPFKGEKALPTMYIHRQSCFLIGRDRKICDLPVDHPSCSKQHAVLQYRLIPFEREDGTMGKRVRPYLLDLESANGTFLNNKPISPKKYYELIEKDVIKFGFSSREYVLLHENSKEDQLDDDVIIEEEQIKQERE